MTTPGYSRAEASGAGSREPAAIVAVDLQTRIAQAMLRSKYTVNVNCSYAVGDAIITPAIGEQWYVERFDMEWRLSARIPFNDPTLNIEPEIGQVSVGSASGPLELNGTTVRVYTDLQLNDTHYRDVGGELQKQEDDGSWIPVTSGVLVASTDITDSTSIGRAVLTAVSQAAARSAIGALSTVASTNITDATTVGKSVLTATDAAAARTAIGAPGLTRRVVTAFSSATPSINTDVTDMYGLTAQAANITSVTLTGSPTNGQLLWVYIVGTAARTISWGSSFEDGVALLPTTTVTTQRLDVGFVWNAATSKMRCMASGSA